MTWQHSLAEAGAIFLEGADRGHWINLADGGLASVPHVGDVAGVVRGATRVLAARPVFRAAFGIYVRVVFAATLVVIAAGWFRTTWRCVGNVHNEVRIVRWLGGYHFFHIGELDTVDDDLWGLELRIDCKLQHKLSSKVAMFLHELHNAELAMVPSALRYILLFVADAKLILSIDTPTVRLRPVCFIVDRNPQWCAPLFAAFRDRIGHIQLVLMIWQIHPRPSEYLSHLDACRIFAAEISIPASATFIELSPVLRVVV